MVGLSRLLQLKMFHIVQRYFERDAGVTLASFQTHVGGGGIVISHVERSLIAYLAKQNHLKKLKFRRCTDFEAKKFASIAFNSFLSPHLT